MDRESAIEEVLVMVSKNYNMASQNVAVARVITILHALDVDIHEILTVTLRIEGKLNEG